MQRISKLKAYLLIEESKGKVFTATFTKVDGSIRVMNCRLGVKKGLTGRGMNYNPRLKQMIPVYDMNKKEYRMLKLDTISELKIGGQVYTVGNSSPKIKLAKTQRKTKKATSGLSFSDAIRFCEESDNAGAAFILKQRLSEQVNTY